MGTNVEFRIILTMLLGECLWSDSYDFEKINAFHVGLKILELNKENINGMYIFLNRSRDSVVGIATGYGLADRRVGVRVPVGSKIFSSPRRPDRLWGPMGIGSFSLGDKAAET
jgi:hypothetical protein